jgi:hypothetical protein
MAERILRSAIGRYTVCAGGLVSAVLWLSAGCARPNGAIATQPTPEELPNLERPEPPIGATVVVEGHRDVPRYPLVPELEPPKLTAAEEEALGVKPVHFKFLHYNEIWTLKGSPLGPWYGGVLTASGDYRNPGAVGWRQGPLTGVSGWGGGATGVDPLGSVVCGTYLTNTGVTIAGPASNVQVATDPTANTIARRRDYREH